MLSQQPRYQQGVNSLIPATLLVATDIEHRTSNMADVNVSKEFLNLNEEEFCIIEAINLLKTRKKATDINNIINICEKEGFIDKGLIKNLTNDMVFRTIIGQFLKGNKIRHKKFKMAEITRMRNF